MTSFNSKMQEIQQNEEIKSIAEENLLNKIESQIIILRLTNENENDRKN